eukprot:jgi/Chlat1/3407/Chrsp23S03813
MAKARASLWEAARRTAHQVWGSFPAVISPRLIKADLTLFPKSSRLKSCVSAAIAAKAGSQAIFDRDVLNFLPNTECLEARFDTFAAFEAEIPLDLLSFTGACFRKAIGGSNQLQPWAEVVALDEQGHTWLYPAVGVAKTWLYPEVGAAGDKGCILLMSNPGLADAVAGLACSASYQSAVDRQLLWDRRSFTIEEYSLRVFRRWCRRRQTSATLSDGPFNDDQSLYNFDTNFVAVPTLKINNVPTDIRDLTSAARPSRLPWQ